MLNSRLALGVPTPGDGVCLGAKEPRPAGSDLFSSDTDGVWGSEAWRSETARENSASLGVVLVSTTLMLFWNACVGFDGEPSCAMMTANYPIE